jgi:hypothetical protein
MVLKSHQPKRSSQAITRLPFAPIPRLVNPLRRESRPIRLTSNCRISSASDLQWAIKGEC